MVSPYRIQLNDEAQSLIDTVILAKSEAGRAEIFHRSERATDSRGWAWAEAQRRISGTRRTVKRGRMFHVTSGRANGSGQATAHARRGAYRTRRLAAQERRARQAQRAGWRSEPARAAVAAALTGLLRDSVGKFRRPGRRNQNHSRLFST